MKINGSAYVYIRGMGYRWVRGNISHDIAGLYKVKYDGKEVYTDRVKFDDLSVGLFNKAALDVRRLQVAKEKMDKLNDLFIQRI